MPALEPVQTGGGKSVGSQVTVELSDRPPAHYCYRAAEANLQALQKSEQRCVDMDGARRLRQFDDTAVKVEK